MLRHSLPRALRLAPLLSVLFAGSVIGTPAYSQPLSARDLGKFTGVYQISSKKFLYIQLWPGGEGKLSYTDDAGHVRALFPASGDTFTAGPGLSVSAPVQM